MALANPWILLGIAFVSVPIVLHLMMQRKPKHLVFPALRFVKQRRESNRRTLRLRHLLLLMLRCFAIFLLVAALAGPSVVSALVGNWIIIAALAVILLFVGLLTVLALMQKKGTVLTSILGAVSAVLLFCLLILTFFTLRSGAQFQIGDREAPVAAVLVIDTAPRMEYRQANETRLERAQSIARWLIRQLPADSDVSIADSRRREPIDQADIASAERAIDRLKMTAVADSLVSVLDRALRKVNDSDKQRKEIYIFTDMTRAAWSGNEGARLKDQFTKSRNVSLYVIDVGAEKPENFSLGNLQLAAESLPRNGELRLKTELYRLGAAGTRRIELRLEKPDLRRPVIRDGQMLLPEEHWVRAATATVDESGSAQVEFALSGLELGVHQGFVEMLGEDSLPIDDRRYFTIEVKEAWQLLVATPPGVTSKFLTEALAPYAQRQSGEARFECKVIKQSDLGNETFGEYAAVCLVDPQPLTPQSWEELHRYVEAGGGLAMFLGHNARANESFNGEEAQKLMPGQLDSLIGRGGPDLFLSSSGLDHPIIAPFRSIATSVPWRDFPVHKYWVFQPRQANSTIVLRYNNNREAIVDKRVGKGRVLTMTTPVSDAAQPEGRSRWNDLPLGSAWPYYVLVNQMMDYLVESRQVRLNYVVGQTVVLPNHPDRDPQQYDLFTPQGARHDKAARDGRVVVSSTRIPGAYRLKGSRGGLPVVRGFSVNLPEEASDLTPTDRTRLDDLLGADRYQFARSQEEINRQQGVARVGREFYPLLIGLLALIVALEYVFSNQFYRKLD